MQDIVQYLHILEPKRGNAKLWQSKKLIRDIWNDDDISCTVKQ